jgi:hypothetical protein
MHVNLRLHGGELVTLNDDESARIYAAFWSLAPRMRGAVSAAGKLHHARAWQVVEALDQAESAALREALGRPHTQDSA